MVILSPISFSFSSAVFPSSALGSYCSSSFGALIGFGFFGTFILFFPSSGLPDPFPSLSFSLPSLPSPSPSPSPSSSSVSFSSSDDSPPPPFPLFLSFEGSGFPFPPPSCGLVSFSSPPSLP
ncbi:hypothetical protein EBU94_03020 [bacterium]|nr:hypothetical protein [bacterium]NBO36358.1 hypothetical protein [bacterium]